MSLKQWISIGLLAAVAGSGYADDAEALIKYRQSVMKIIGGHMQAMSTIVRGNVYGENLAFHAAGIAEISRVVPTIFPEGSGAGKTDALADIWKKPDEFKRHVEEFRSAAAAMAEATGSGDRAAIGGAMRKLGGACKGCHDDFRAE